MWIIFLVILFTLVVLASLHEFGHFILAKKTGVKVEEFGIGLPPRLGRKKIGETIYSLNLIPFGAFIKVKGEEGGVESESSFSKKTIWQRALIIVGGVVSFWIIGAILLTIVFNLGVSTAILDTDLAIDAKVQIISMAEGSPAQAAGLQVGDTIKKIRHQDFLSPSINKMSEVQEFVDLYKGKEIVLTIERGKEVFELNLVPRVSPPEKEGPMGVGLARTTVKKYPFYLAPFKAIEASINITFSILAAFGQILRSLFQEKVLPPGVQIMGPVKIGIEMSRFYQMGLISYLQFVAILSFHLAIINLLPIPALDGGRLLFLGIEKMRNKPLNKKIENKINAAFFSLLILLLIFITIGEISTFFKK